MFKRTVMTAAMLAVFITFASAQAKPPITQDTPDAPPAKKVTAPPAATDDGSKAIRVTEAAWVKAFASKDVAYVTAFYADDAVLMANGPTVSGKAAILDVWKGMLADPNFSLTFSATKIEMAKSGDLACSFGTYTLTLSEPKTKKKITDKGKYLTVWKKQADSTWKAIGDVANSDPPPTPVK
jgi:uncharacterized protein (TIGR02246 family)